MSATVRIYDLAKDLKQEPKRVIEELRREGADVSVPSNSVSTDLAEKIRNKYFPKAEATPKRGIKVIKKKIEESAADETSFEEIVPPKIEESVVEEAEEVRAKPTVETQPKTEVKGLRLRKVVAKPKDEIPVEAELPEEVVETEPEIKEEEPPQPQRKKFRSLKLQQQLQFYARPERRSSS